MLQKTKAIVLSALRYQESSLIVKVFTRSLGLQSLLVQSVGKPKSTFKASYFLPLTQLEVVAYFSGKGLSRLKEVSLVLVPHLLQTDVVKMAVAGFMTEVLQKCIHEGDQQTELFDFVSDQILDLEEAHELAHFPLKFVFLLSEVLGFQPGSFQELAENQTSVSAVDLEPYFFQLFLPDAELSWPSTVRRQMMELYLRFYQWQVDGFGQLQSLEVLKEVLRS